MHSPKYQKVSSHLFRINQFRCDGIQSEEFILGKRDKAGKFSYKLMPFSDRYLFYPR